MDEEEIQRQKRIASPRVAKIVSAEGRKAYARADAWAHSVPGTPYGSTEPVLVAPRRSGTVPDPLDPRVMEKLLNKGDGR